MQGFARWGDGSLAGSGADSGEDATAGIMVLTPSESKRLIAKGVAAMPAVSRALENGRLIISNGTTTAYVAEELLGIEIPKYNYAFGIISGGVLSATEQDERRLAFVMHRGKVVETPVKDFIREFERDDVFIKGANAVDPWGFTGGLMSNPLGGTWAAVLGVLQARGCRMIVPVGLEKMIPSVVEASRKCGILRFKYSHGNASGLMPIVSGETITEIQALNILAGVSSTMVSAGGIDGSEGSVVLAVEGRDENVARAFEIVGSLKGECPTCKVPQK
ncbi:MAG: hypothetical protein M1358_00995 [Chloroflexi bacterium]|nr:hypothetical protein [Chloroflexota bacterium]